MTTLTLAALILAALPGQADDKRIRDQQATLTANLKNAKTPAELSTIADSLLALSDEAMISDSFDLSLKLVEQAQKVATGAKDAGLVSRCQSRANDVKDAQKDYAKAKSAFKTLEANDGDPDANLVAGKFMALSKGQWTAGVTYLSKCSDAALKVAAQNEQGKRPELETADAWWKSSLGMKGSEQAKVRAHALDLYQSAWPKLDVGEKERVRQIARAAAHQPEGLPKGAAPAPWTVTKNLSFLDERISHSGKNSMLNLPAPEGAKDVAILTSNAVKVQPGQKLNLSVWTYSDGTGNQELLGVKWITAAGDEIGLEWACKITGDTPFWTKTSGSLTAPANAGRLVVLFRMGSLTGKVWADDLSMRDDATGAELLDNGSFERK